MEQTKPRPWLAWPSEGLWREADFLMLWSAQGISALGSRITRTALPILAVLTIGATVEQVAILSALALARRGDRRAGDGGPGRSTGEASDADRRGSVPGGTALDRAADGLAGMAEHGTAVRGGRADRRGHDALSDRRQGLPAGLDRPQPSRRR